MCDVRKWEADNFVAAAEHLVRMVAVVEADSIEHCLSAWVVWRRVEEEETAVGLLNIVSYLKSKLMHSKIDVPPILCIFGGAEQLSARDHPPKAFNAYRDSRETYRRSRCSIAMARKFLWRYGNANLICS